MKKNIKKTAVKKTRKARTSVKQCKDLIKQAQMIIVAYQLMSPYKNPILSQAIKTFEEGAQSLNNQ